MTTYSIARSGKRRSPLCETLAIEWATSRRASPASGFASFGFSPEILSALEAIGYSEPSPIQKAAIPELLLGRDVLGQAQTGTGKTAAFALPLLASIDMELRGAGDVLGPDQSGHVEAVGIELYTHLLHEAVAQLKEHQPELIRFETAIEWLKQRTLDTPSDNLWKTGARYNLARTYEALGDLETARKTLLLDESPQKHGAEIMDTYEKSIQPSRELPESVPGSILRVLLDEDHWLSSGTDLEIQVMVDGNRFLAPLKLDKGTNVGIYAGKERLLVSGLLWPGSAPTIARTPYLLHQPSGQGRVIAFSEDPNYRAYAEMTQFLFINALLLGTAF